MTTTVDARFDLTDPPLTWQRLCEFDRELARLERLVRRQRHDRSSDYCANEIWYGLIKPRLRTLVGFEVGNDKFYDRRGYSVADIVEGRRTLLPKDHPRWQLKTMQAYAVATEHLYDLMPDCRHDGDCRW